jgi:hypothetical protein
MSQCQRQSLRGGWRDRQKRSLWGVRTPRPLVCVTCFASEWGLLSFSGYPTPGLENRCTGRSFTASSSDGRCTAFLAEKNARRGREG